MRGFSVDDVWIINHHNLSHSSYNMANMPPFVVADFGVILYCCSLLDVTIGNFRLQRYISNFDKVNYTSNTLKFFVVVFTCSVT